MRTTLLIMPFFPIKYSSMAGCQIKTSFDKQQLECEIQYLNRELSDKISHSSYQAILHNEAIAEWIFACQAFDIDDNAFFKLSEVGNHKYDRDKLLHIRVLIKEFIDNIIDSGSIDPYEIIGFNTSFTGQLMASLALSKRIKELYPSKHIVVGGYSVFGNAGYECMKIPWVDFVCHGEGDHCFAELCKKLSYSKKTAVRGFYYRDSDQIINAGDCAPTDLNDLSFFGEKDSRITVNSIESTRGCWYGVKNQCTFCQLNYKGLKTKNPDNLYNEIISIATKTNIKDFEMIDYLVHPSLFSEVLPRFVGKDFRFSMMIRPTLPLKYFKVARDGGVYRWFAGLENMHPELLKLCRKGQSPIHNLSTLKWSKYYGIQLEWNFLYSIPGEKEEWYYENWEILKKITHFDPPLLNKIQILKDTPYVDEKLVSGIRPHQWCEIIYPNYMNLYNMVRSFSYDSHNHVLPLYKIDKFLKFLSQWKMDSLINGLKSLTMNNDYISDTRTGNNKIPITSSQKSLLRHCDIARKDVQHNSDVDYLLDHNLLIYLDEQYLSLVEPLDDSAIFEKSKQRDAHQPLEKGMIPLPVLRVAENICSAP